MVSTRDIMSRVIQRLEHPFLHLIDSRKLHANIQHSRAQGFARFMSILKISQEKPRDFFFHHLEPPKGDEIFGKLGEISIVFFPIRISNPPKTNLGRYEKCRFLGHEYPIQNHQTLQPHSMARVWGATNFGASFSSVDHIHTCWKPTNVRCQARNVDISFTWQDKVGPRCVFCRFRPENCRLEIIQLKLFTHSTKFQGCLIGDMLQIWDGKNDVQEIGKPGIRRENQVMPALAPLEPSQKFMNGWCAFQDLVVKFGKNIPKNESHKWLVFWKTASSSNYYNHPRKKYRKKQVAFLNCRSFSALTNRGKNW